MESINGLPAHVLLVHAPVVLVPLATLLAVVATLRPGFRRQSWWLVPGAVAVGLVATQLAVSSGYRFDEIAGDVVDTTDHQALGETTRNLVVLFLLAAAATAWLDRRRPSPEPSAPPADDAEPTDGPSTTRRLGPGQVASIITTLVGAMSTIWMIRTGDEGARLVWDGVLIVTTG